MPQHSHISNATPETAQLTPRDWGVLARFNAMASPCELLIANHDSALAEEIAAVAIEETRRIEQKYSRFIQGNYLWQLNNANGKTSTIDTETFNLLTFATQCYELSDGRFDISAGPLMRLWRFESNQIIPSAEEIALIKPQVNFATISFTTTEFTMPSNMSLDLGGIGKEYAVDRVANLLAQRWPTVSILVNFGGDIACPVAKQGQAWQVGIENPEQLDNAVSYLTISQGALATSGNTRRFIEYQGKQFGHIIDPQTGYPVIDAPRSVTVIAPNCITAGMLATLAMLQGLNAESFLLEQQLDFKVFR